MKLLRKQRGLTLIMLVFIVGLAATAYLMHALNPATVKIERDKKTAAALAEAKAALVGYAAAVDLNAAAARPGDLPCPDTNNDGSADTPCAGNAIGRLPWKTLGINELRDGDGERLWYAVSVNFKNNPRLGTLNSDTLGTITLHDNSGNIVNDGSLTTGVVAIIISPGAPLVRQDGVVQVRDIASENLPLNYLDIALGEDNQAFVNGGADGFINGTVRDANRNIIVNDRLLVVSRDDLFGVVEKRVAGEALRCLEMYAAGNGGRYPLPAKLDVAALSYQDTSGQFFGRLMDTPFANTQLDNPAMGANWPGSCMIVSNAGWWLNWKEIVFFAVADEYKPTGAATGCGSCLTVSPPFTAADKRIVVMVAGRALAGQNRLTTADKGSVANYLEAPNNAAGVLFTQQHATPVFNDIVVYR